MLNGRNPTKQKKLHHVKEIATWDELGQVGASWEPKKLQAFDIKKTS